MSVSQPTSGKERFHTNEEGIIICSLCHFTALQDAVVAQHFKYVHEKVRDHKCVTIPQRGKKI
jgi:hypothetical protein